MESGLEGGRCESLIKFDDVKPICCDVMKEPSEKNLLKLSKFLETISAPTLSPEAANYIIFPLLVHLKAIGRLKSRAKELLLKSIQMVLSKSVMENDQIFMELFQNLNMLLGQKDNQPVFRLTADISEEMVTSVETSLLFLLRELSPSRLDILYDEKNIGCVGHCIYMQIQVVNSDLSMEIRIKAVEIMERLFSVTSGNPDMTERMFAFIPGVVIALRKAASSRVGRSRRALICKSLEALATCLAVSLEHEAEGSLEKVDSNLSILMRSISDELVAHEEQELRAALSRLSMDIITRCEKKLPKSCEILWRNIRMQSWDPGSEEIRRSSQLFLRSAPEETSDFEESLKLLKVSCTQLLSNNVEECEMNLKLLASNLFANNLLFVDITLLLPPLVKLFTVGILQNRLNIGADSDVILFRSGSFPRICGELCEVIKERTTCSDVIEEIVPFLSLNITLEFNDRLENNLVGTLFFFNQFMLSCSKDTNLVKELQSLDLANVASLFLEIMDTQTKDRSEASGKVSTVLDYESILLVEGLGTLACIDTQGVLPLVLYILLEQAGNSSGLIAKAGEKALLQICSKHSSDFSIQQLLTENLDLIMSELSTRTSAISSHPNCPEALIFLAKYFDFGQPDFVSCIEQAFSQSCDRFYSVSQEPFARIFLAFLFSLWSRRQSQVSSEINVKAKKSLGEKILDYQRSLGIGMDFETVQGEETVEGSEEMGEDAAEEEQEKALGPEINLVLNICQRVLNFLPTQNNRSIQITSLDCLIYGVQLLRKEENTLLPLAHTIWQNLMPRFGDNDLNVVRKSFELLLVLCKFSGSFMKKRVVEEVFPKLSSLLMNLSSDSERFHHKDTLYYTHTQSYKLQMVLLEGLAELCLSIELNEEELDQVVSGCLLYLKPRQHKNLVEAASKLLQVFANSEQGSVIWMKLYASGIRDYLPGSTVPPSEAFTPFPEPLN